MQSNASDRHPIFAAVFAAGVVTAGVLAALPRDAAPPSPAPPAEVTPPITTAAPHELAVTLERTRCYGTCPEYHVAIYRDGTVEYTGAHFVKIRGPATWHVPHEIVAALDLAFASARFAELDGDYTTECVTDSSSASITYARGAHRKRVDHYHGACNDSPQLTRLEDAIDLLIGIDRAIGSEREREDAGYSWAWY